MGTGRASRRGFALPAVRIRVVLRISRRHKVQPSHVQFRTRTAPTTSVRSSGTSHSKACGASTEVVLAKVVPCGWTNTAGPSRSQPSNTKLSRTPLSAMNSAIRTTALRGRAIKERGQWHAIEMRTSIRLGRFGGRYYDRAQHPEVLERRIEVAGFRLRTRIKNY